MKPKIEAFEYGQVNLLPGLSKSWFDVNRLEARVRHAQDEAGRQLLAGGFGGGGELAASINLHSVEELGGGVGGSGGTDRDHVPAREHVASGELFDDRASQGRSSGVSNWTGRRAAAAGNCGACARHRDEGADAGKL